jgi:prepilin peptidase CpaA
MNALAWINSASLWLFAAALVWAAASDLLRLRIPNAISLAIVGLYAIYLITANGPVAWQGALLTAGIVLVVGFILFSFRVWGGGDVKLLTAVALWAGPAQIIAVLFATALIGGVLAFVAVTPLRMLFPYVVAAANLDADVRQLTKMEIPYGVGIAVGGLLVVAALA